MHCCTCTRLDQAYLLTRIMSVCMQEGMDERFAQSMLKCMHKSIVHSNLHEAALTLGVPRSSAWPAHCHVRIQVTRGIDQLQRSLSSSSRLDDEALQRPYTRSLLNRFMSLVTHRPSPEQDKDSVSIEKLEEVRRAIRLGVLCCELTKACLDRAGDVLRDFSMRLSIAATKYLLLSTIKILDVRYVLRAISSCICAHTRGRYLHTHTHSLTCMHIVAGCFRRSGLSVTPVMKAHLWHSACDDKLGSYTDSPMLLELDLRKRRVKTI
jgi:hypothetical protein